jgi:hypothetical protein
MESHLPEKFKLDSNGRVLDYLRHKDHNSGLDMMRQRYAGLPLMAPAVAASRNYAPVNERISSAFLRHGFVTGASVAIESFYQSDVPVDIKISLAEELVKSKVANDSKSRRSNDVLRNFYDLAAKGMNLHPEAVELVDLTERHFEDRGPVEEMGTAAFCGAGMTILWVDEAYDKVIDGQFDAIKPEIDWDSRAWGPGWNTPNPPKS